MDPTTLDNINGVFDNKNGSYLTRVQLNNRLELYMASVIKEYISIAIIQKTR